MLRQIPDPIPTYTQLTSLAGRTTDKGSPLTMSNSGQIFHLRDPIFCQPHERVGRKLCTASLTSIQGGCVLHGANQPPRQHLKSQKQWTPWLSHETMMAFQSAVFKFLSWGLHFWKLTQNNGFGKIFFHLETLNIGIHFVLDLYMIYVNLYRIVWCLMSTHQSAHWVCPHRASPLFTSISSCGPSALGSGTTPVGSMCFVMLSCFLVVPPLVNRMVR